MTRQIACGHCGRTHGSVAEVRACSTDHPVDPSPEAGDNTLQARPDAGAPRSRRDPQIGGRRPARSVELDRTVEALAGPACLGRSVLIAAGSPIPEPWRTADVVTASASSDGETVDRLHRAWRDREGLVIEWSGDLPPPDSTRSEPFHQLTPAAELPGERLRFSVTANAVNMLGQRPTFDPISLAAAAGAEPSTGSAAADVTTESHGPVVVDGGPLSRLDPSEAGRLPVVPRVHLVAGLVSPQRPDPSAPTADLAADQLAAVAHDGGPARIIAPAGSGKTRVLTERTRHLVADRGIDPAAVSLVAYNRRARLEMSDRLADIANLDIRTLNSLALAIATGSGPFAREGDGQSLTTISELDARRLLDRVVPGRRRRQLTDPLEPWIDALSACRLGLRDPDEIEAAYGGDIAGFPEVLTAYRAELRRRGELDFDEQILRALELLLTDPHVRAAARRVTPVLLVDEFQDLTPAHLLLIRLLAGPAGEVVAVGDDDQTIYGYSGASPEWLVDFDRFFPGADDLPLTVNYRCPDEVVTAAANLLSHNRYRVPKTIRSAPDRAAEAVADTAAAFEPLIINTTIDPQRQLVEHVAQLLAGDADPDDIAVLARVNAALLPAVIYLADAGIPVARPIGVDRSMLERSGVGAAFSWLRLASAPEKRLRADDLRMAVRRPPRSLHPRIADWVCEQRSVKDLYALAGRLNKEREAQIVAELAADIEQLRKRADSGASTVELLDEIYDGIGLLGAASQLDQSQRSARRAAHADELAAIRSLAAIGPGADELEAWISEHLQSIPRTDDTGRGPAVAVATIHSTKGLEWPHVIVHDVRGDLHPHRLAIDTEEERRIFHVAVTRCRTSVLINGHPASAAQPRSPFVVELQTAREAAHEPLDGPSWSGRVAPRATPPAKRSAKSARAEPSTPTAAVRRNKLTEWRTERCKVDGVPAYVVMDNATLDAIAEAAPDSLVALGRIKGIGPTKLDRYGSDILGIVADAGASA